MRRDASTAGGVEVRRLRVAPTSRREETSNNTPATAAFEHRYPDLLTAGVEVWELPGTVVHATKVVVAERHRHLRHRQPRLVGGCSTATRREP
jgi:hypothetical protein